MSMIGTSMFRLLSLLLLFIISACTSPYRPLAPGSAPLEEQVYLVSSLKRDESIGEVSARLPYKTDATFDLQSATERVTYLSLRNEATGAAFGLFFIDDRLMYVIPPKEKSVFFVCRDLLTPSGSHWTDQSLAANFSWLREHSILGAGIRSDQQIPAFRKGANDAPNKPTALDAAVTVAVYSPFLVLASPALVYVAFRDNSAEEAKEKEQQRLADERHTRLEKQRTGFPLVQLGITRGQVIQYMGEPDKNKQMTDGSEYMWFESFFGIIVHDGKVTLKESSVYPPFWLNGDRSRVIDMQWLKSNDVDPNKECPNQD